jgi:hypothetical protein
MNRLDDDGIADLFGQCGGGFRMGQNSVAARYRGIPSFAAV